MAKEEQLYCEFPGNADLGIVACNRKISEKVMLPGAQLCSKHAEFVAVMVWIMGRIKVQQQAPPSGLIVPSAQVKMQRPV